MTTSVNSGRRPSWAELRADPAQLIAFGFGLGKIPAAPGTFGSLAMLPVYQWLAPRMEVASLLALVAVMFALGVWACDRAGRALGVHDHRGMVWDEMTAFLLLLSFAPPALLWQVCAFLLFRLFDVVKPPPIRHLERRFQNGFGVMLDDLVAAFYTLIVLAAWRALTG
ncbi:phosphatidylglycerophosphatase A family protein [Pelomicrobium sp.]|uniref:phosphatidylglycerophosphatase A family protein n=1 Tax=Pelomicrobium sp. TaxID=2815319 RepID=UPI002FDCEEEF